MSKNILVVCALGYATSTMMKKNIEDFLEDKKLKGWKVEAIGMKMSESLVKEANIIVTSMGLNPDKYSVPVLNGIPLISGINKQKLLDELYVHIKEVEVSDE